MNEKEPTFSDWVQWGQRSVKPGRDRPGVYLLARFEEPPPREVDPTDERVLLIAETHDQSLDERWGQFHRSAFKGASGHAGGLTFHKLFSNGADSTVPTWLYVSALPVPPGITDIQSYVQGWKSRLLAEFEERHGTRPRCNMKGPGEIAKPIDAAPAPPQNQEPRVEFTSWIPWADRYSDPGSEFAGVYALARFDAPPPSAADVLDRRVVYIGETCENTLGGRLWQFNRSAFEGKAGHSGGWTYRSRFADRGEQLYVSIFPVEKLEEPYRSAFIRHIERKLLWDYVKRWNQRPECNSK